DEEVRAGDLGNARALAGTEHTAAVLRRKAGEDDAPIGVLGRDRARHRQHVDGAGDVIEVDERRGQRRRDEGIRWRASHQCSQNQEACEQTAEQHSDTPLDTVPAPAAGAGAGSWVSRGEGYSATKAPDGDAKNCAFPGRLSEPGPGRSASPSRARL